MFYVKVSVFYNLAFFQNSFIEIKFTYHTTHPFKAYNLVIFSISQLYNHHHNPCQNIFIAPKRNPIPISSYSPSHPVPLPQPYTTTNLLYVLIVAYSGHFIQMESYSICSFMTSLFSLTVIFSRFIHIESVYPCQFSFCFVLVKSIMVSAQQLLLTPKE